MTLYKGANTKRKESALLTAKSANSFPKMTRKQTTILTDIALISNYQTGKHQLLYVHKGGTGLSIFISTAVLNITFVFHDRNGQIRQVIFDAGLPQN